MEEALEAQQLGHTEECLKKCVEVSNHAIKALFNISAVDSEAYRSPEEAIAKGLKDVFEKTDHGRIQSYYAALNGPGEPDAVKSIEMASFLLSKAIELVTPPETPKTTA